MPLGCSRYFFLSSWSALRWLILQPLSRSGRVRRTFIAFARAKFPTSGRSLPVCVGRGRTSARPVAPCSSNKREPLGVGTRSRWRPIAELERSFSIGLTAVILLAPAPTPCPPDARLPGLARPRLSLPRQGPHRDNLRPRLLQSAEDQSQSGVRRADRRRQETFK